MSLERGAIKSYGALPTPEKTYGPLLRESTGAGYGHCYVMDEFAGCGYVVKEGEEREKGTRCGGLLSDHEAEHFMVARVHYGDPDDRARAYNQGYDDAVAHEAEKLGRIAYHDRWRPRLVPSLVWRLYRRIIG